MQRIGHYVMRTLRNPDKEVMDLTNPGIQAFWTFQAPAPLPGQQPVAVKTGINVEVYPHIITKIYIGE